MALVTIDVDLPPGSKSPATSVTPTATALKSPGPGRSAAAANAAAMKTRPAWKRSTPSVVRHLDVWGQPSFWVYEAAFHRCPLVPPSPGPDPAVQAQGRQLHLRFEEQVVRLLIGSTEEEVARRLGISAETVGRIVKNQWRTPRRSTRAGHQRCGHGRDQLEEAAQAVRDGADRPDRSRAAACAGGETGAGRSGRAACLEMLTARQREQVHSYRVDMGPAFNKRAGSGCPTPAASPTAFTWPSCGMRPSTGCEKKITRAYKAKLSRAERKEFRSLMWEFRRDPAT